MTYAPHLLIAFGGRFFTSEQWSCNIRLDVKAGALDPYPRLATWAEEQVEDISNDVATWFTSADARISSAARLDYVKVNPIGPEGRYASEEVTIERRWLAGDAPSGTASPTFPQLSAVLSFLTDAERGRASRGRIYPPTGATPVTSATGRIDLSIATSMANAGATLLSNLNNQPGLDLESPAVVIASGLGTPGPMREVTSVAVGDVIDTQRRRRNQLVEAYASAPVV